MKKILNNRLFVKHAGVILVLTYVAIFSGICTAAALISSHGMVASESKKKNNAVSWAIGEVKADDSSANKDVNMQMSDKEASKSEKSYSKNKSNTSSSSSTENKVWVEPVYKTVQHEAVTKQKKVLVGTTCACGAYFSGEGAEILSNWQAHRPVPCDGKHTYHIDDYEVRTVVVEPAWTEQVLVKEGYWKEG